MLFSDVFVSTACIGARICLVNVVFMLVGSSYITKPWQFPKIEFVIISQNCFLSISLDASTFLLDGYSFYLMRVIIVIIFVTVM